MSTQFRIEEGVAVIELDNPPVNALGFATRLGIVQGIERALATPAVGSIVLVGSGRCFSAGADLREFSDSKAGQSPDLGEVIECIERSAKPVVAALHGMALGGGLELALGCHYRVAAPDTRVGLPEIRLGMHPGAGGTQRLPRCVGLEKALEMMLSGTPVRAAELSETRLFDRIGAVPLVAMELAREVGARSGPHLRVRDVRIEHPDPAKFFATARGRLAAQGKGASAALKCVDALEGAMQRPFDEGLRLERENCVVLARSPEAKALRHAFFAERAATKIPGIGPETRTRTIARVAIVGAGSMGRGIGTVFLNAGIPVTLIDPNEEALRRAAETLRNVQLAPSCAAVAGCDLIVEAVFEDYGVKETVFREIDAVAKDGAILASSTATLNLDRMALWTRRPQDVIGMHFFNPADGMKLVEIVRGGRTAPDVLATVVQLAGKLGKAPVVSGVCDGFIGNRMFEKCAAQAMRLLAEGVLPEQIDRAIEAFGFAMGPFRDRLRERIARHGEELGVARREVGDEEIVERLVQALAEEGKKILQEGIALRASDIDIVYINGYGFPAWRGGPMYHVSGEET